MMIEPWGKSAGGSLSEASRDFFSRLREVLRRILSEALRMTSLALTQISMSITGGGRGLRRRGLWPWTRSQKDLVDFFFLAVWADQKKCG